MSAAESYRCRVSWKDPLARDHLVEHRAKAEEVSARSTFSPLAYSGDI